MGKLHRRDILQALFGLGFARTAQARPARPFCMYSVERGWTDNDLVTREYITRRARHNDVSGVPQVVARIRTALRFAADFDIYIAEQEHNAFATVANGRKILVVDVDFLEALNRRTRTRWSAIQVIAHEVGHHIAGFLMDRHASELSADYWSGQSLHRLGAGRQAATRAILAVGSDDDTPSHPSKHRRSQAIQQGWEDSANGRIDERYCNGCV